MEDISTNLWYYYYSAKIKKYLTRNSPISLHTVVLRLFRSKTRGRTTRDENETKLRANSRFQSLSFPRRFPIIRYLTRVPLSRSYVTQQRVSVRVFPKRFMNYVDGWVRGRGVCAYRGDPNASGLFWQNVVYRCGIWWIGICMEKKGLTFFHFIESSAQSSSPTRHGDFSCRAYSHMRVSKRSPSGMIEGGDNRDGKRDFYFLRELVWEYSEYSSVVSHLFEVLI